MDIYPFYISIHIFNEHDSVHIMFIIYVGVTQTVSACFIEFLERIVCELTPSLWFFPTFVFRLMIVCLITVATCP